MRWRDECECKALGAAWRPRWVTDYWSRCGGGGSGSMGRWRLGAHSRGVVPVPCRRRSIARGHRSLISDEHRPVRTCPHQLFTWDKGNTIGRGRDKLNMTLICYYCPCSKVNNIKDYKDKAILEQNNKNNIFLIKIVIIYLWNNTSVFINIEVNTVSWNS